jgi:predicted anti-sigma-YlaC factor YlaD
MLTCEEFRAELSNLVDDETARSLRTRLDNHLAECRTCQILYDSTRKTVTILTDTGAFEVPPEVTERLTTRILSAIRRS